ncbi:uncharacterized protein LOC123700418 [Colias croceus]|uniref:uncharacterized protein LOC123700418 n=1 Tax=Colias crocea TaxID=72248 RepID=UPI001E2806E5|nr:uncharacterized protein LOC123700418 [Colias croceus]
MGPVLHEDNRTTCEEFGKYARFNPHSILNDWWMSFYYWGPTQPTLHFKFCLPTPKEVAYLKYIFEGHVLQPINWTATLLLMHERSNYTHLLVEQGDRGEYLSYTPYKDFKPTDVAEPHELRIKQVNNGRYIGFMVCDSNAAYAFARYKDVPRKKDIQDVAATIGYKGRGGKSYLYQGHEWMPIPEADDTMWETFLNKKE